MHPLAVCSSIALGPRKNIRIKRKVYFYEIISLKSADQLFYDFLRFFFLSLCPIRNIIELLFKNAAVGVKCQKS